MGKNPMPSYKRVRIEVPLSLEAWTQWEADRAMLERRLGIHKLSQIIPTAMRIAAHSVRSLSMTSGEVTRIYPGNDDTWTLQIGDEPLNIVEKLPSAKAALDLVINA